MNTVGSAGLEERKPNIAVAAAATVPGNNKEIFIINFLPPKL